MDKLMHIAISAETDTQCNISALAILLSMLEKIWYICRTSCGKGYPCQKLELSQLKLLSRKCPKIMSKRAKTQLHKTNNKPRHFQQAPSQDFWHRFLLQATREHSELGTPTD